MTIERILVPLDGSMTAEAILPHVKRLLRRSDAEVVLLRAVLPPPAADPVSREAADEYVRAIQASLERAGARARSLVREGPAAEVILDAAVRENASLIALSTHGHTGAARIMLGSVAERVLRGTPAPVLTVRPFSSYDLLPRERVEDRPILDILAPVEASGLPLRVLAPVIEIGDLFGARVTLLHAAGPEASEAAVRDAMGSLTELAAALEKAGIESGVRVIRGHPVKVIVETATTLEADLIAMTTHGRSGLARLLAGSVTEGVLRNSTVPVLVARASEPAKSTSRNQIVRKGTA